MTFTWQDNADDQQGDDQNVDEQSGADDQTSPDEPANDVVGGAQEAFMGLVDGEITQQDVTNAGVSIGLPILKAIILIVIVLLVARWAKSMVVKVTQKAKVELTLSKFFGNLARWSILVLGAVTVLQTFGIEATSFAAVIAALGFAIGLALSGTIGNVASGVMLLVFRPYRVGDVVNVAGCTGKVDEIELFTTTLDTADNRRIIIPNNEIFGSTIENITHHPRRRADVSVGTDYAADLSRTREVLMGVATSVEGRLPDEDPVVYLSELGASSVDWSVRVWTTKEDYWAVRERLTENIKVALDDAGIGIPFPQRDIHVPGAIKVHLAKD